MNVNDPNQPIIGGVDVLELSEGAGRLSVPKVSAGRNGPPDSDRIALTVEYFAEGTIRVSGGLDLFNEGRSHFTELAGDLDDGKVLGTWEEGDGIVLELFRR